MTTPFNPPPSAPVFLLIQDDVVMDRGLFPQHLRTEKINEYAGFKIALGYINVPKGGSRSIVGVLADVEPLPVCSYWRISSEDCDNAVIDATNYRPAAFVKYKLSDLSDSGQLHYPPVLPPTLTIKPAAIVGNNELNDPATIKH